VSNATEKSITQFLIMFLFGIFLTFFLFSLTVNGKQMQPDPKRVGEIRAALILHGYEPGKSWGEVQEMLRGIADKHGWQVKHAPDARVLILLGLGNKYSDPSVALEGTNHVDYRKSSDPEENRK
jgi:hypothetical protein